MNEQLNLNLIETTGKTKQINSGMKIRVSIWKVRELSRKNGDGKAREKEREVKKAKDAKEASVS